MSRYDLQVVRAEKRLCAFSLSLQFCLMPADGRHVGFEVNAEIAPSVCGFAAADPSLRSVAMPPPPP
jgi:hypothetical protein